MDMHPLQRFINDDVQLSLPIFVSFMRTTDGRDITDRDFSYKGEVTAYYCVHIILVGNKTRYIHYKIGTAWLNDKD